MASPVEDDIFEKLKLGTDPKEQERRQAQVNESIHRQHERFQTRITELVGSNSTLPVTISEVRVLNAKHTRRGFLEQILHPLLNTSAENPYTLQQALKEINTATGKLTKLDIFRTPISVFIDKPDQTNASSTPSDIQVYLSVVEKGRFKITTGTEAGTAEGSAYVNGELRNLFGGAESLTANASLGTRTRSSYSGTFNTPVLSNPDLQLEVGGLASSTLKHWASHEEALKGGQTKLRWNAPWGHRYEVGYSGFWRQITGLAENASPTVRADAGDSFKSSLSYAWINDQRDYPLLPSSGYLIKTVSELAGWGPLSGDVAFSKFEMETQAAVPVPLPGVIGNSGVSFTAGLRGGMLWPLALGFGKDVTHSRLNDRFQLGSPTDVRGFRQYGLGPRDGPDAVGGDVYAAGGASILFPFPRVGPETPLRFQAFINAGRLLALQDSKRSDEKDSGSVAESMKNTIAEMGKELPSCAAGFGVVYAHPAARFELNFSLPLVLRKGEEGRKGLSFGVGINFL